MSEVSSVWQSHTRYNGANVLPPGQRGEWKPRNPNSLGALWEGRFFGMSLEPPAGTPEGPPEHLGFRPSVKRVIAAGDKGIASEGWYPYNPKKPKPGPSRDLWMAVKQNLPPFIKGVPFDPLFFYVAIGSSLDVWHGRDAFFLWRGVLVAIDVSCLEKSKAGVREMYLKADRLFMPKHVGLASLCIISKSIAGLLKARDQSRAARQRGEKYHRGF